MQKKACVKTSHLCLIITNYQIYSVHFSLNLACSLPTQVPRYLWFSFAVLMTHQVAVLCHGCLGVLRELFTVCQKGAWEGQQIYKAGQHTV